MRNGSGAPGTQQLDRIGKLVEPADTEHTRVFEKRFVRAVLAGDRARVGSHHSPGKGVVSDLERNNRDIACRSQFKRPAETRWITNRLHEDGDNPGALQRKRVLEVFGHGRDQLVPARHGKVEADLAAVAEQRRE